MNKDLRVKEVGYTHMKAAPVVSKRKSSSVIGHAPEVRSEPDGQFLQGDSKIVSM